MMPYFLRIIAAFSMCMFFSSCVGPQVIKTNLAKRDASTLHRSDTSVAIVIDDAFSHFIYKIPAGMASYDFNYGQILSRHLPLSVEAVFSTVQVISSTKEAHKFAYIIQPSVPKIKARVGLTGQNIPTDIRMDVKIHHIGSTTTTTFTATGHSAGVWSGGNAVFSCLIPIMAVHNAMGVMSRSQDEAVTNLLHNFEQSLALYTQEQHSVVDDTQRGNASSGETDAPSTSNSQPISAATDLKTDANARLRALDDLKKDGLISDEEYRQKRNDVLNTL